MKASFGIGTGRHALTQRFDPRPDGEERLARYLIEDALPRLATMPEIVGAQHSDNVSAAAVQC